MANPNHGKCSADECVAMKTNEIRLNSKNMLGKGAMIWKGLTFSSAAQDRVFHSQTFHRPCVPKSCAMFSIHWISCGAPAPSKMATAPETCGVAILVLKLKEISLFSRDGFLYDAALGLFVSPGAEIRSHFQEEYGARSSVRSVALTAWHLLFRWGGYSFPVFPAAAITMTFSFYCFVYCNIDDT